MVIFYIFISQHIRFHLYLNDFEGDFKRNDDVYEELERQELEKEFDPSLARKARTLAEMTDECLILRGLFDAANTPL